MELNVTVQIGGKDTLAGKLYQNVRHGAETTSFIYNASYVANPLAFPLAPDMPLEVAQYSSSDGLKGLRVFEDCIPDRWGRNLMLRAERQRARAQDVAARTLFETDMLCGVNDITRQGAIRIWDTAGSVLSDEVTGVPREVLLPQLLNAADLVATDMDADVKDLLAAGSSLGGARPKASIQDEQGVLYIAKFPKADETKLEDVCAWEYVVLKLMEQCGIAVPSARLERVGGRAVLLTQRFDRAGSVRIPYISGLTALQGTDGQHYSYLELASFIEEEGAQPDADLCELWRRMLFTCAVGNTDNHMRNYGFLRKERGWVLCPAFDVNATAGDNNKYLATSLDFDRYDADPRVAFEVCEYFRVSTSEAKDEASKMAAQLKHWSEKALSAGIDQSSIKAMETCFTSGIKKLQFVSNS